MKTRPEVAEAVRTMVRNTPIEGYIACCQAIAKLNLTDRLPGITIPTLVVVGADDPATTVEMANTIHQRIAGSELVILKHAAHLSNLEQADAFDEAVLGFLARNDHAERARPERLGGPPMVPPRQTRGMAAMGTVPNSADICPCLAPGAAHFQWTVSPGPSTQMPPLHFWPSSGGLRQRKRDRPPRPRTVPVAIAQRATMRRCVAVFSLMGGSILMACRCPGPASVQRSRSASREPSDQ